VTGRRDGATTAVAGTKEWVEGMMPGIAGRSGMSLGMGVIMPSR